MVSVERYMTFFKSDEYTYWEQTDLNSTFENLSCRKDSFQKLTIFSQGNNVLYAATSNRNSFLGEIHVFHEFQGIGLFGQKRPYHHFQKPRYQDIVLSKTNSILTAKQCAICCSS
jgi:hypothetical protein